MPTTLFTEVPLVSQLNPPASRSSGVHFSQTARGTASHSYTAIVCGSDAISWKWTTPVGLQLMGGGVCPYLELQAPMHARTQWKKAGLWVAATGTIDVATVDVRPEMGQEFDRFEGARVS